MFILVKNIFKITLISAIAYYTIKDEIENRGGKIDNNAVKYDKLSFQEAIDQNLKVMDQQAFKICQQNNIAIRVFNIYESNNIIKAAMGEEVGTIVR